MTGKRWWFFGTCPKTGAVTMLAEATPKLGESHARVLAHLLADDTRLRVTVYAPRGKGPLPNPTLVAHGLARAASWHIVSEDHEPLADLYYNLGNKPTAARIARLIANLWGSPVKLLDNASLPPSLKAHPRSFVAANPATARRLEPVVGEIWHTYAGERAQIKAVTPSAVVVYWIAGGNREWLDPREFATRFKAPGTRKLNPLPRGIDPRSIRTVGRGAKRLLVGCPKGEYQPRRGRCKVGTRRVNDGRSPNPKGPICLNQIRGRDWVQEWYETATRDAGARARELRKLGYRVTVEGMGSQVTPLGRLNLTLVDYRGGDLAEGNELPPVTIERMNPRGPRGEADEQAATELELFIENDADLYRQQLTPILQNLWRKMVKGKYDHELAVKLWMYLCESGAKKYAKEFDDASRWMHLFTVPTRLIVARSLADKYRQMLEGREFSMSWQTDKGVKKNPRPTADLPPTWLWTGQGYGQDRALYAARDTRWPPNVPDLVSTSRADVIRQALENDKHPWVGGLPWSGPMVGRVPNPKGREYARGTPTAGTYWQRHEYPQHLVRVVRSSRDGMVSYDVVTGHGAVMGSSRIPLNEFLAKHSPLEAASPYRKTLPNRRRSPNPKRPNLREVRTLSPVALALATKHEAKMVAELGLTQAFADWRSGRAYLDNAGNYRLRSAQAHRGGRQKWSGRGRVAPWNRAVKAAFASPEVFHRAAQQLVSNPGRRASEHARGVKTFKKWHAFAPHRVTRVRAPRRIPRTMVRLGELESLVYRSDKWAGGPDNPRGKHLLYEHTTQRPRPVLATDPDGRDLFIVGGKMRVTADGLVH